MLNLNLKKLGMLHGASKIIDTFETYHPLEAAAGAAAHALLPQREPTTTSPRSRRGLNEGGHPTARMRLHDDLLTNSAATTRLGFHSSSASLFSYHFQTLCDYD
jgi:hypothetical protein